MKFPSISKTNPFEGYLLTIGVGLLPIYVFSSGGVQPAHMILALFSLIALLRRSVPSEIWIFFLVGISFYSFFVESFYVAEGAEAASIMSSVFFFYNLFLVCAIYAYCRCYGISTLKLGVLMACVVAIGAIGVGGVSLQESGQGRATGTFNNPNQLGYFSVCVLSLTYLLYCHGHLKYIMAMVFFSVALFFSIASLSKAAMIANFVVAFLVLKPVGGVSSEKSLSYNVVITVFWILVVLFGLSFLLALYLQGAFDDYLFVSRLQGMTQEDDSSLGSRGYFAFLEGNTIQIILGLGSEGVADIVGHEVHSTLASVFNNYGILGFLLFSGALAAWALNLWRAYGFIGMFCLTGPAMLYGITHNGTRFTAFWVLFAASMAMAARVNIHRKSRRPLQPLTE